jgi:hypothetical protein
MKTSLKITLATVLVAVTIASCWKNASETSTPEPVDTTHAAIDTARTMSDTLVP